MRILLVNDDGYQARGIKILEEVLLSFGHDVYVIAPHTEQSAKSHAMTVKSEMVLFSYDDHHYSLKGTPADCVIFPIKSNLLNKKIDLVISGINNGYNLSSDIIYSGTCAAARQASMYGIKAIALSEEKNENGEYDFYGPAKYVARHLDSFTSILNGDYFLSINFPPRWNGRVEKADIGIVDYNDEYFLKEDDGKIVITNECKSIDWIEKTNSPYKGDRTLCLEGTASASIINNHPFVNLEAMEMLRL